MLRPHVIPRAAGQRHAFTALAALLLVMLVAGLASPAQAQSRDWDSDAPEAMEGKWAVSRADCTQSTGTMIIVSDGGYRWRKEDGSWGLARGSYSYIGRNPSKVLFKLRRIIPRDGYESEFYISGNRLRKFNVLSRSSTSYTRCP
ncbi:MAG: hypothetical protein ACPGOY_01490 [Rhodospirillaceae bacterium]